MNIVEFKNFEPIVTEEAMLIPSFKKIRTMHKEDHMDYFSYVFFMYDFRSDFNDITDINARTNMVMANVLPGKKINETKELTAMIATYVTMQNTPSMRLVYAARAAMSKIEAFLNEVDLTKMDGHGKPIYNVKQIADVVGNLSKMTTALNELEATVKREMDEGSRIRGGGEKSFYEDTK